MTTNYNAAGGSPKDTARDEAGQVKNSAQDAAKDLAGTAQEQAGNVKDEAASQAKDLASSVKDEASSQAATQQQRLAQQSRSVTDDLHRLSRGERPESDTVSNAVSALADRAEQLTHHLENKEPADLLDDVRRFAARRPAMFLAIAAGVGVVAGRLTRGLTADDNDRPSTARRDVPPPPADYQFQPPTSAGLGDVHGVRGTL